MTILDHRLTNDILFKVLFTRYPELLKPLVAELLGVQLESIETFHIRNTEMPPELLGDKFCRLDIAMTLDGQRVNLEVQVENEGNYAARSLYHWAREYSTALPEGEPYGKLPRAIVVSIVDFNLFNDCPDEFHSEFLALEVKRHTLLTDKFDLHFFELPKLPKALDPNNKLELWLSLFKAKTEEELAKIYELEVPIMNQAIEAYRHVSVSPEFKELERMRSKAGHDKAQALYNAEQKGHKEGRQEGLQAGRQEGLQAGRQEGLQAGEQRRALSVARKLLGIGLSIEQIMMTTDLTRGEIEKLRS